MSDYPVTIDTLLEPDYALGLGASNPTHPEQHTLFKEILAALEAKVGTNNSPDPTSIDSLLKNTTVGHHHDGIDSRAVAVGGGAHPDLATHDALGLATDAELATHAGAADPHTGYQKESEKGAVNGYAGLDGSGTVPDAQLPAGLARDTEVSAAVTAHEAAGDPHAGYELESAHTKAAHDALALSHDSLADVSNDDHHPKSHGHTGADGSGTVAHSATTGQTANDHHNESHAARHADGGADEVVDAGQSVSTQAFGDAASVGADTAKAAPVLHKHAMPANPVTAHEAAADPHTGYVLESLADAKGDILTATADNTPARLAVGTNLLSRLIPDSSQASGLAWGSHIVRKTSDETVNSAGTGSTLQNDDELLWAVAANEVWFFQAWLLINAANNAMDFKAGWSVPSGTTMQWGTPGFRGSTFPGFAPESTTTAQLAILTESGTLAIATAAVTYGLALAGMVVASSTPGNVSFQWAQNTSDAGNLKVLTNSILLLWRLA